MKLVVNYDLRWNTELRQGAIWLKLDDGSTMQVPISSADEFTAVALLLTRPRVVLHEDGTIEAQH